MAFLAPNKRLYLCTRSMLNFQKFHPDSIVLTNAFSITWSSSFEGTIVMCQNVLQVDMDADEFDRQVEEFVHFMELYTFAVMKSTRWALPARPIKKVEWTPSKVLRRFSAQLEIRQSFGTNVRDFVAGARRNGNQPPRDYLIEAEVPDQQLREVLNRLYSL